MKTTFSNRIRFRSTPSLKIQPLQGSDHIISDSIRHRPVSPYSLDSSPLHKPSIQFGNCRPTAPLQQCFSSPRPFQNYVVWPLSFIAARPSLKLLNANHNCFGSRHQSICKVLLSSILDHAPFLCSKQFFDRGLRYSKGYFDI